MYGLASRTFCRASSTSANAARTLKPGWVWIIAAIPSRRSRLSSMSTSAMGARTGSVLTSRVLSALRRGVRLTA